MFTGFESATVAIDGIDIHYVKGGGGPPLLLLHGHPQTLAIWHKVAEQLAQHFTVVAADLRGYGDSAKPPGLPDHSNYSKRAMADDQVGLMRHLGFERFAVLAHDRGARVAYRMALDHPAAVSRLIALDIAPTLAMYEKTTMQFAMSYYHWFFLIRPFPYPETMINANPELYLRQSTTRGASPFSDEAWAEYLRCIRDPATVHGICEDYRASAGIDLEHERLDLAAGRKIACPMLVLWGADGVIGKCFDPLAEWAALALDVRGKPLASGHYIPEEAPETLLAEALPFLLA
jgi:haloacetate dehalogenase